MAKMKKFATGGAPATTAVPAKPRFLDLMKDRMVARQKEQADKRTQQDDKREQKDAFKQDRRDKMDAFRQALHTYRQGDRVGPRPVRPEFDKDKPPVVVPPVIPPTPPVVPPVVPPAPVTPAPVTPAPVTPAPVTPAPVAPTAPPPGSFQAMKKGGKVKKTTKKYVSGGSVSSASKRGDGCAIRGKTRGRNV